jgi:HemY protein
MIRVVIFLVAASLLALGVVWLADRPGQISITWLGHQIDTSIMVTAGALVALVVVAVALWSLIRFVLRSPHRVASSMKERRRRKGFEAVSQGLIAVGAGDARAAQRFATQAQANASSEPLTLLLQAQSAQLSGDRAGAEAAFRAMAQRGDTRLLGLRGLYVEAQRHNDLRAARMFAEEAAKHAPALSWAGQVVLEFRCAAQDWDGALAILDGNRNAGVLDRAAYRRQRAVLLTAKALAAEEGDRDTARAAALEAVKLAPDLVPAAALAGRLLAESGEARKAAKIIEAAWKTNPHPDLADAYAHVRLAASARERLARIESLVRLGPRDVEAALAVARAALDAREFATARKALEPLAAAPTQRVATLMAELEELEHGDEGRAREWMSRALHAPRDPAWTADGFLSDRWLPVSPVSGRLDAFQWKVPVAELAGPAPVEEGDHAPVVIEPAEPPAEPPREVVSPPLGSPPLEPAQAAPASPPVRPAPARPAARPEPIMPLTQVPDDPGPDPDAEPYTELGRDRPEGWQRIRQIFR